MALYRLSVSVTQRKKKPTIASLIRRLERSSYREASCIDIRVNNGDSVASKRLFQRIKSDRSGGNSPPIGSYCLAESSISKTSPCNRATSAAGSISALEPASNNRGLQTRYFNSTGATTDEIAPGDAPGSCNQTWQMVDKRVATINSRDENPSFRYRFTRLVS